jgi:hypothetical protein
MSAFPIDRTHPPRRITYRRHGRPLEIEPWAFDDIEPSIRAVTASLAELRAFMPWAHLPR